MIRRLIRGSLSWASGSGRWRSFTTDANELVADVHDHIPVILAPADYARWLGEEPNPRDLMRPLMRMWQQARERRSLNS